MQKLLLAILSTALLFFLLTAIGNTHFNEDLFMALNAGRDILQGKIGRPDTWSFLTNGQIWVNQAWLSDLLFYLSYLFIGSLGPCFLKGLLLCLSIFCFLLKYRKTKFSAGVVILSLTTCFFAISALLATRAENFALFYFVVMSCLITHSGIKEIYRQIGSLVFLGIWSNSHGSFFIGFGLILVMAVLRLFLWLVEKKPALFQGSSVRSMATGVASLKSVFSWFLTSLLSIPIMALLNPYGAKNLLMPFIQAGTESFTTQVKFWFPLLKINNFNNITLYGGIAAVPFLITISFLLVLLVVYVFRFFLKYSIQEILQMLRKAGTHDHLFYVLVFIFLFGLTIIFGRTSLFLSWASVPIFIWLFYKIKKWVMVRRDGKFVRPRFIIFSLSILLLGGSILFFEATTARSYLQDNPFYTDTPLKVRPLGPLAGRYFNIFDFFRKNQLPSKVLASWLLADGLRFYYPEAQVFMDARAQSIYTAQINEEYDYIMASRDFSRVNSLLLKYDVSAILLENKYFSYSLANDLIYSDDWRLIYVDEGGMVFVRKDYLSKKTEPAAQIERFIYPSAQIRAISEAFYEFNVYHQLFTATKLRIRQMTNESQPILLYYLLALEGFDREKCLKEETKQLFQVEMEKLSQIPVAPFSPGFRTIVESNMEIMKYLQLDQEQCPIQNKKKNYKQKMQKIAKIYQDYRKEYLPWYLTY